MDLRITNTKIRNQESMKINLETNVSAQYQNQWRNQCYGNVT